jgi:uncharacterized membrane-anchored protein
MEPSLTAGLRAPRRAEGTRAGAPTAANAASTPLVPTIAGTARLGRRTKLLAHRLTPRDIAVIDHEGLDRTSAEDLITSGVGCVVNASPSCSGRYPNAGPSILVEAGVHLVDVPGAGIFDRVADGDLLRVRGANIRRGDRSIADGRALDRRTVALETEAARHGIAEALEDFAENTVSHLREERELLGGALDLPGVETPFRGRVAVVVVRGPSARSDLRALERYVRAERPALVGVDGGADTILDAGFQPDVIVGDMDSASDRALRCGAELLVHAYRDGHAPGRARLDLLGVGYKPFPAPGTSEDGAFLLAAEKGARLIVSLGPRLGLSDFLDRGRAGMASTFLTRLRVGEILVDARGLSLLSPGEGVRAERAPRASGD